MSCVCAVQTAECSVAAAVVCLSAQAGNLLVRRRVLSLVHGRSSVVVVLFANRRTHQHHTMMSTTTLMMTVAASATAAAVSCCLMLYSWSSISSSSSRRPGSAATSIFLNHSVATCSRPAKPSKRGIDQAGVPCTRSVYWVDEMVDACAISCCRPSVGWSS